MAINVVILGVLVDKINKFVDRLRPMIEESTSSCRYELRVESNKTRIFTMTEYKRSID